MKNNKDRILKLFTVINESFQEEVDSNVELSSKVNVEAGLHFTPEMKKLTQTFMEFCAKNLGLDDFPEVNLLSERVDGMTYGSYNPSTHEILVYSKDRGFADVLRTASHELVHYWQNVENRIPKNLAGRDTKLESEANTKAGDFVYMFGLEHPEIYNLGFKSNTTEIPVN